MLNRINDPICALPSGYAVPRHLHESAYATLVLEGSYEEAGEGGRWRVQPGEVLIHAPFSIHRNQTFGRGAQLLNLPLPLNTAASACGIVADADLLARLAERDLPAATTALLEGLRAGASPLDDAPDRLAAVLSGPAAVPIQTWSQRHGISRHTVFRGFRSLYGVSPTRFRVEARARRAWRMILTTHLSLAEAAHEAGYTDQAHMTRHVKALTDRTPSVWAAQARLHHSFKTRTKAP
jgi:AraC-like DNA-binding protein